MILVCLILQANGHITGHQIPPQINVWHSPQVVKVPMHATRRGGGKEKERERDSTHVRSFIRAEERERRKDDRKGDGVADSAQKVPEVLVRLDHSSPILGLSQAIALPS